MLAIVTAGLLLSSGWSNSSKDILGYATEMSSSNLLSSTNAQRVAQGVGSLAINSLLSQAAQNKAQDMANKDYWSHTSPDGSTPWTFIDNAGYSYVSAGENLAYGFTTSNDVITGWMNSPSHRENLLKTTYTEVGFGIVNAPNYQSSGPQTIVVAMYGQPTSAPAPAPVTTAPTPTSTAQLQPKNPSTQALSNGSSSGGASKATPAPAVTETAVPAENKEPQKPAVIADTTVAPHELDKMPSQDVSRVQAMTTKMSWTHFAVSMLASVALLALLLRHTIAWHKLWSKGEKFVLKHPLLDILFVLILVAGFVLTRTAGFIR